MTPKEMRSLVDAYIDAYNRMDIDDMLAVVHPEVEFQSMSDGVVNARANGVAELRALAEQSLALFSERRQLVESFEVQGSRAVASIAFRAVVADDLPNGWTKGRVVNVSGRSEFDFRDGAIFRIVDIS
ncbi:MAG: nuclear transport factor 2 family protein [Ectothiorhodospiraceae bacterium]|nr:nuclear transport factor 2 family protein [Ectothiorhodospiraceae bacterium]MCH8502945.1 nuclear transport factor 2 family protein [Ectothiorhodospiraceae bacterium]